jgi:predicted DNA-binding protein (MmcQ/YjbR family)
MRPKSRYEGELRRYALGFPEANEDFPWGERVIKVRKKVFVFLGTYQRKLHVSVKLPESSIFALTLPFTEPTGYGLGKAGWVTARLEPGDEPPADLFEEWIDESYRAVAPKKLVAALDGEEGNPLTRAPKLTSKPKSKPKARKK